VSAERVRTDYVKALAFGWSSTLSLSVDADAHMRALARRLCGWAKVLKPSQSVAVFWGLARLRGLLALLVVQNGLLCPGEEYKLT